eukprot:479968-Hanusia_phi.AAC.1
MRSFGRRRTRRGQQDWMRSSGVGRQRRCERNFQRQRRRSERARGRLRRARQAGGRQKSVCGRRFTGWLEV